MMQLDPIYLKSAIETIDLVKNLMIFIKETPTVNKDLNGFLKEIFEKADSRISSSSLGKDLGINIEIADTKGKTPSYWKGVRDTANLVMKKRSALSDVDFNGFLSQTKQRLEVQLKPESKIISPLEEMLSGVKTDVSYEKPAEIPDPTPIQREVKQYEEIKPVEKTIPTPAPEPVYSKPSSIISEPEIPKPKPITPAPEPVSPSSPEIPADMMAELTKPVATPQQSSVLESQTFQDKSLADMLLQKEETPSNIDATENDEDQMLSMTLREALKILRDEDED